MTRASLPKNSIRPTADVSTSTTTNLGGVDLIQDALAFLDDYDYTTESGEIAVGTPNYDHLTNDLDAVTNGSPASSTERSRDCA